MKTGTATENYDVLIVGGGMVGAALAGLLAPTGLRVGLLDRAGFEGPAAARRAAGGRFDPRVSAIAPASARLLDEIGAWPSIVAAGACPYRHMDVWDGDGTGSLTFAAAALGVPELGYIVENSVILEALHGVIASCPNVTVRQPFTVTTLGDVSRDGMRRLGTAEGATFAAGLIIAADGSRSRVRQRAGIGTREWDYGHTALVATVRTERPHGNRALQRFMTAGPLAFLPLAAAGDRAPGHDSAIVWSQRSDRAAELMALPDDEFRACLGAAIEHRLGAIRHCGTRLSFPLRQCHAVDYVRPGLALVGDAAHAIHPLAGQGVNLGFQDARILAAELAAGIACGRAVGDLTMLRRYQRRRRPRNLAMMALMEALKRSFAADWLPLRWARNVGLRTVDGWPALKRELARSAMGDAP